MSGSWFAFALEKHVCIESKSQNPIRFHCIFTVPKVFLTTLNILTTSASIATSAFTAMAVPWRPVIFYSKWIRKYTIFPGFHTANALPVTINIWPQLRQQQRQLWLCCSRSSLQSRRSLVARAGGCRSRFGIQTQNECTTTKAKEITLYHLPNSLANAADKKKSEKQGHMLDVIDMGIKARVCLLVCLREVL